MLSRRLSSSHLILRASEARVLKESGLLRPSSG